MIYLALGDSISIDDYTEIKGGGAASQFATLIQATTFANFTRDGATTSGILTTLLGSPEIARLAPDIVTVTAGGNDLLEMALQVSRDPKGGSDGVSAPTLDIAAAAPITTLLKICEWLAKLQCPVILNTIYDPTDGDDALAETLDIPVAWRRVYDDVNAGIRDLAARYGFLLSDLQALFHGHGIASRDSWFVLDIEPNLAGASAISQEWYRLYSGLTIGN